MSFCKQIKGSSRMLLRHTIPLLGSSLLITSACATTSAAPVPPSSPSSSFTKEKAANTAAETQPPKRSLDGSAPFTMPEIEERLLKVLALPPAQINKESVAKIFGIVLNGNERPLFFEEISADKQTIFSVTTPAYWPSNPVFDYKTAVKKNIQK